MDKRAVTRVMRDVERYCDRLTKSLVDLIQLMPADSVARPNMIRAAASVDGLRKVTNTLRRDLDNG